jgi:phospholipase/carboxylesterase
VLKGAWNELAGLRYVQVDPEESEGADLPLIIAVHGRGADAADLAPLAGELSPGAYRWILPQGPRPVPLGPGYTGWAWYELGDQQAETVVSSRDALSAFVDASLERLGTTRGRTVLMGFSQGGVMTLHVGLSSTEPFAGLAVMSGYIPAPETLSPILPERRDRSVLMVHGVYDQVLEIERARTARALLESAGIHPEYHEFPMDHQITPESLAVVREYVNRVLPG